MAGILRQYFAKTSGLCWNMHHSLTPRYHKRAVYSLRSYPSKSLQYCMSYMDYKVAKRELEERRVTLCQSFFDKIQDPNDNQSKKNVTNTKNGAKYPVPKTSTNRFKNSFLPLALYNLQLLSCVSITFQCLSYL